MRSTIPRLSEMPGPKVYNAWWGDYHGGITKQKGISQYTISSNQSRPAHHLLRNYLFNGYGRLSAQAIYFVIPFGIGYSVYAWAKKYDEWQNSKAGHIAMGGHH